MANKYKVGDKVLVIGYEPLLGCTGHISKEPPPRSDVYTLEMEITPQSSNLFDLTIEPPYVITCFEDELVLWTEIAWAIYGP